MLRVCLDFITFPLRALTLFGDDMLGLTSLPSERMYYVAGQVRGYCLDVGCGRGNRFITHFLAGNGVGIDVYQFEGLTPDNVVSTISRFPFESASFDTTTFIASINHVPHTLRETELAEAYRCLKDGGNIVVTMGMPVVEIIVHMLARIYSNLFGVMVDEDNMRGMTEGEDYFLRIPDIVNLLKNAGFRKIRVQRFSTQWGLNSMVIGWK
jgi:SAM-dependent methyltransferase